MNAASAAFAEQARKMNDAVRQNECSQGLARAVTSFEIYRTGLAVEVSAEGA